MIDNITLFFSKCFSFFRKDFLNDTSYKLSFFSRWIGIFITFFTFYYLSKLIGGRSSDHLAVYGGDYFSFVLIGLAAISYLNSNIHGLVNTVGAEQRLGLFEIFLSSPTRMTMILISFCTYSVFMGMLAAAIYLILGGLNGVDFSNANILAAFVIVCLATIIFISLGVIGASCVLVFKRGDPVTWVVTNLFWLFGGAYFPITVFPDIFQRISLCIPSTYVLRALRLVLLQGHTIAMVKHDATVLIFFSLFLSVAGFVVFKGALYLGKKKGTIIFH